MYFEAGDTTKTALSALFFYLSRNPESYHKLAHEIRSTFTSGNDIRGASLTGCQYLRACIDEALRISPPAPATLWRELRSDVDDESFVVDGHVLPRGTLVGVNIYSVHHNEEYFPDSFAFRPERWLDESSPDARQIMREAFVPFSIGARGCAGKTMAYTEISLVLAKTLWYFDFAPVSGELGERGAGRPGLGSWRQRREEFQLYDVFTAIHEGPYLTFKPRGEDLLKDLERKVEKQL
jgi:cytochrome P450